MERKPDTIWNIPRNITFSTLHLFLYRGKSITFGTVWRCLIFKGGDPHGDGGEGGGDKITEWQAAWNVTNAIQVCQQAKTTFEIVSKLVERNWLSENICTIWSSLTFPDSFFATQCFLLTRFGGFFVVFGEKVLICVRRAVATKNIGQFLNIKPILIFTH